MVEGDIVYWMKAKVIRGRPLYTISKIKEGCFVSLKDPGVKHVNPLLIDVRLLADRSLAEW